MHPYLHPITQQFRQHADAATAASAKAYMLDQFPFFGLYTPQRRLLFKEHFRNHPVNGEKELEKIVKECFTLAERDYQYFGIELFTFHKKIWSASSIKLMEHCITTKSWWDSVDHIASEWTGPYFKLFPENTIPVTERWNRSDNMWLQRSSIMFQKAYKKNTDTGLLSDYILHCRHSKEFFIQKAIGWALREYSKTDPGWVTAFVKKNKLAPLSEREALKRIDS